MSAISSRKVDGFHAGHSISRFSVVEPGTAACSTLIALHPRMRLRIKRWKRALVNVWETRNFKTVSKGLTGPADLQRDALW